jgi:hypothetical protein
MKRKNRTLHFLVCLISLLSMTSCVQGIKEKTKSSADSVATNKVVKPVISNFYLSGTDRFIIEGTNLADAKNVKITQGSSTFDLVISSKTNSLLSITVPPSVRFFTDVAYTLFVSNSYAQASFPVTFVIDNNEITTAKIADGAITSAKLDSMGANAGQALVYNGVNWAPGNLNGLSFMGGYTPAAGAPPSGGPVNGDFYVVDTTVVAVDIDGAGPTLTDTYVAGDWVIYDGATTSWIRIDNSSTGNFWEKLGANLNFRTGNISIGTTLTPAIFNVSETSLLGTSGDGTLIDLNGDVLAGSQWVRGISYGLEGTKHVRMGATGTTDGTTASLDHFYINLNSADATPWATADFIITSGGFVGIKTPSPTSELDVTGTITATNFVGDGSGITNVTSTGAVTNTNDSVLNADSDGNASGEIQFNINGVTQAIIDNGGNFGVGTSTTRSELDIRSTAETETSIISYQDNDAVLTLGSNSGLNPGAEATTLTGTTLGTVGFAGYDGTNFASTSTITSNSTEAWGAAAKGSNLIFSTTVNGATTPTERMRIAHNGNVGIGNVAPAQALDVTGNAAVSGNVTVGGNTTVTGTITSTGNISGPIVPTGGLSVASNSGQWTTSNFNRNLGLGVADNSSFLTYPIQTAGSTGNASDTVFGLGVSSTDGHFRIVRSTAADGTAAQNSDIEITETGTVIIPNSLQVGGSVSFTGGSGNFTGAVSGTTGTFSAGVSGTTGTFTGALTAASGAFSGAVSGTTGNFTGGITSTTGVFSGAVSGTTGTFTGALSATSGTFSSTLSTTSNATITGNLAVDTNSLFVDAAANRVGVLNVAPTVTFDVTGDINASSSIFIGSVCHVGVCTSDERFKKNIEEMDYVSDRFAKVRSVEYEWRNEEFPEKSFHDKKELGVIAQEVQEQFPELVHEDEEGYLKVDKTKLQAYAMKALKEQIVRNDKLEKENEQMKKFLCEKFADAPFCQ